jgi:RNA polymerase sigma-70 factor (ECF subfamily)
MPDEQETSSGAGLTDDVRSDGFARAELEALRDRDPAALAKFFDVYFDRVYGYVRRLVGEEHLAEDLTQDVFVHLHRSLPGFDAARELRPWVFTIATNKVRDFWRSRRHRDAQREQSVEREAAADHLSERAELRPENSLSQDELDAQVREAVDRLPDGMRTTVLLRIYEGLSFEAIGRILERNEVAVRKRYSRALELLRESLGGTYRLHEEGS